MTLQSLKAFKEKSPSLFSFFFVSEHLNQVFSLLSQVFVAAWWQFSPSAFLQPQFALQAEANRWGTGPLNGIITYYYEEKNRCLPQISADWCQYHLFKMRITKRITKIGAFGIRSVDMSLSVRTLERRKLFTASDKKMWCTSFHPKGSVPPPR